MCSVYSRCAVPVARNDKCVSRSTKSHVFFIKALHCMVSKQRDGDYSSAFFTKWHLLKFTIICERNIKKISNPR